MTRGGTSVAIAARRTLGALASMLAAAALLHALVALAPGDAAELAAGGELVATSGDDTLRDGLRAAWGLDAPVGMRIVEGLTRAAAGDLGTSWTVRPGAPVRALVAEAFGPTLARTGAAIALVAALSAPLAAAAARGGWIAVGVRAAVRLASSPPAFLAAFLSVTALNAAAWSAMERGWIARPGWFALPDEPSALRLGLAVLIMAVAGGGLAEPHAALTEELARVRRAPFVDAVRARGGRVVPRLAHHLLAPTAATLAARVPWTLGAAVVVERLMLLPGAGSLLWQACRLRDAPLAVGIALVAAGAVIGTRLCADLARTWVDPRERSS